MPGEDLGTSYRRLVGISVNRYLLSLAAKLAILCHQLFLLLAEKIYWKIYLFQCISDIEDSNPCRKTECRYMENKKITSKVENCVYV